MRNLLSLLTLVTFFFFAGCSSKTTAVASDIPLPTGKVAAYMVGPHMDAKAAQSALEAAGFEVLATYEAFKEGQSIVFTNAALKALGAKENRGYAAVLRLLVDDERKQISITNPIYFGKAFLQEEYDHKTASEIAAALNKAFPGLKDSTDAWGFEDLEEYHFMMGMPYYKDYTELATGDQAALVAQADDYKKGKKVIFKLQLSPNSVLYGYDLGKRTKKFVKKIGTQNAQVLPYTILIENGKVKTLSAKFFLAVSYPQLTMGEFMTIATVPGAIEKDLAKPFK
jgi:hypothetical protein